MKNLIYIIFLIFGLLIGGCINLISFISPIAVLIFLFLFFILLTFNFTKDNKNNKIGNWKDFIIVESLIIIGIWLFVFRLDEKIQIAVLIFNISMFLFGVIMLLKEKK